MVLRRTAAHFSNRYNLRIAMVTSEKLILKLKKSHPELFLGGESNSSMVLRRYDGTLFKDNPASLPVHKWAWWLTANSVKPVD